MAKKIAQQEINDTAWRACDTFRGTLDPTQYKDYILVMLFVKYVSDVWTDKREQYEQRYKGNAARVERALARERFAVPAESHFDYLYSKRNESNLGEIINIGLQKIEDENKAKLENVFRNIDFNSESHLGQTRDRNRRLQHLLDDFRDLNLRPSRIHDEDLIGNTYQYLIERFAADAGKKGGEFFTPKEVAVLLARLLNPKAGDRICDPACGSGSLLIRVGQQVGGRDFALFGQESNGSTWALCRMNMFLHEMDNARIEWCNTITGPRLVEDEKLMKFNVVVANPPFSLKKWGAEDAASDPFNRFWRGIPPQSKGDYAFVTHMIETALEGEGRVGVIVPHGVLFRGGSEGAIRQHLVEEDLFEAVIGLPPNLFFGTGIPAAILVLNKGKKRADKGKILFIEASRDFEDGSNQNRLRDEDIDNIVTVFRQKKTVEKYSTVASAREIAENGYNLNIPRYVDTYDVPEKVRIPEIRTRIAKLEAELTETRTQMASYLKELGHEA